MKEQGHAESVLYLDAQLLAAADFVARCRTEAARAREYAAYCNTHEAACLAERAVSELSAAEARHAQLAAARAAGHTHRLILKRGPWYGGGEMTRVVAARKPDVAIERAEAFFSVVEALAPKRLVGEDLGDALEFIHRMIAERKPRWLIYAKIASTAVWFMWNVIREWSASLQGRERQKSKN